MYAVIQKTTSTECLQVLVEEFHADESIRDEVKIKKTDFSVE